MEIRDLIVVHDGDLAKDVAEQLISKKPENVDLANLKLLRANDRPKKILPELGEDTLVCFVLRTIENASPTEEVRDTRVLVLLSIFI